MESKVALRGPAGPQRGAWVAGEGTAHVSIPLEAVRKRRRDETPLGEREKADQHWGSIPPGLSCTENSHVLDLDKI